MKFKSLKLTLGFLIIFSLASSAQASVYLLLEPSAQNVAQGSQFTVDMNLSNVAPEQLSYLNLWLCFDPAYLQVIDADSGNWITADNNVLDGPYHGAFNWDFHGQNTADNAAGAISYGEGSFATSVLGNGTFARIYFLAMAPVLNTQINYVITGTDGLNDSYVTDISANNILGGVSGASVSISAIPEPGSFALLGIGLLSLLGFARRDEKIYPFRRK